VLLLEGTGCGVIGDLRVKDIASATGNGYGWRDRDGTVGVHANGSREMYDDRKQKRKALK
jgi:hypothetical protein